MDKHIQEDNNNPINNYPTKQEEKEQKFKDLLSDTLFELCDKWCEDNPFDYLSEDMQENLHEYTADQIRDELQDNGFFDVDIIYYNKAILYLMYHDNSLRESLEIARQYGFNTEDLNSELLATLLASRNKENNFYENVYSKLEQLIINKNKKQ